MLCDVVIRNLIGTPIATQAFLVGLAGRECDPETGLFHYRSRAYDPSTGRFLQEDPIWFEAGDFKVYRYVWNSPANWTDPSGMAAAGQYASTLAVPVALMGGTIATQRMLSTASGTARYLASADKNALSTIGAAIACTFYTFADALNTAMQPNMQIVGVSGCGVLARSTPPNEPPKGGPADDPAELCDVQLDSDLMMCKTIATMKHGKLNETGKTFHEIS